MHLRQLHYPVVAAIEHYVLCEPFCERSPTLNKCRVLIHHAQTRQQFNHHFNGLTYHMRIVCFHAPNSRSNLTDLMPATPLFKTGKSPASNFGTNFSTPTPSILIEPFSKSMVILSCASNTRFTRFIGKCAVIIESPSSMIVIQFFILCFCLWWTFNRRLPQSSIPK